MDFSIVTDTAGARVGELASELRRGLEPKINAEYSSVDISIGIAIRCLSDSDNRKSFTRYTKKDNYITIDFCVSLEEYSKMYKIEQKFNLGNIFLEYLNKALDKYHIKGLDKKGFVDNIIKWGKDIDWFANEIDWTRID